MELNLQDLLKANKRVEAALNRRYERNAELFISKQDVDDIKKWLHEGQFSYVYSKFKAENIHPDIYFLTVLKNSWLIKSIDEKEFKDFIYPILKQVRPHFAKSYLQEVAERKMDVPDLLRKNLLKYFMRTLTTEEANAMLTSGEALGVVRIRLLIGKLLEKHIGTEQFISALEKYAMDYPEIRGDNFFLKSLQIPEALQRKHIRILGNWINNQADMRQVSQYFINGLYFNYELLYEYAIEQAKQHVGHIEKRKIWFKQIALAAGKLIRPKTEEVRRKQIIKEVIQLYDYFIQYSFKESPYYIRYCFKKIHHDQFREQLKLFFTEQRVRQVQPMFLEDLQDALTGRDSGKISAVEQLAPLIEKESGNSRYLHFLAFQFLKMHPNEKKWSNLFKMLPYTSICMKSFITTVLRISKDNDAVWEAYFQAIHACRLEEIYALDVIIENVPTNKIAKRYIEQRDYQRYSEIYRV